MATQGRSTLKGYFNTGDQPTEAQFAELIESGLNLVDGGTITGSVTIKNNAATASFTVSGSLSEVVLANLPTTKPTTTGSLWLSGSAGDNSVRLLVFTGA